MTEIFAPDTLYLCDGLKECCVSKGCKRANPETGTCEHTKDEQHSKNGFCEYPQNHPERFKRISIDGGRKQVYVEKELHGPLFQFIERGSIT